MKLKNLYIADIKRLENLKLKYVGKPIDKMSLEVLLDNTVVTAESKVIGYSLFYRKGDMMKDLKTGKNYTIGYNEVTPFNYKNYEGYEYISGGKCLFPDTNERMSKKKVLTLCEHELFIYGNGGNYE